MITKHLNNKSKLGIIKQPSHTIFSKPNQNISTPNLTDHQNNTLTSEN